MDDFCVVIKILKQCPGKRKIMHLNIIRTFVQCEPKFSLSADSFIRHKDTILFYGSFLLRALDPPTVVDKYTEIAENATIREECTIIPGNPRTSNIRWSKGNVVFPHKQLVITHISRHDAGNYTCEATNLFDKDELAFVGNHTGTLRLIVLYPTTVTRFFINGMIEEKEVTLVETGNVTIHCFGDGNPAPTLTLITNVGDNQRNETLATVNSTYLCYGISTLGSHHSGKYTCVTSNRFGEKSRTLHLIIKQLHEIAKIMQAYLVTQNETSANLRWILADDALFHVVENKTCFLLYKTSEQTEWINDIADINRKVTQLDFQLMNLRPDTQYEAKLIANLSTGNYSIAPSLTFRTLSFSKATGLEVVVAYIVGSVAVLIVCIGVMLRMYTKRSLLGEIHGEINNKRINVPISPSSMNTVGNATALILSGDEDHYDCIRMSRTTSCINLQDANSGRFESSPSQVIGETNPRDTIRVKTETANKVAYEFLDRTRNQAEDQYNSMAEVAEGDMDEYVTGCCHSSSSDTDSIISDKCLQCLTGQRITGFAFLA
ncbi:uncharacterized protein LOC127848018 [Dreissena polymorpha]|uniref:uncharacterized protein LOC127848018 n=1 Tax=Dreissena polymorpha TaxID=45954 RepID=UPI002264E3C4|nr:uncharacterized protein LOC127848018 [Dreissena polymorpha]